VDAPEPPPSDAGTALVPAGPPERPPFALWLRKWRRHRDLSQQRAAELVGYSRNYWAQLETGRRGPTVDFLEHLAHHAGLSAQVLADWAIHGGPAPENGRAAEGGAAPGTPEAPPAPTPAPPYPPYPGYPGYPPYPTPYPPYPAYPAYPEYPAYPGGRRARLRRRPRQPRQAQPGAGPGQGIQKD
jgi:transcriptional regulator with XRE-family HTH domain